MSNPFKSFKKKEWALWIVSLVLVIMSNLLSGNVDVLTLSAACVSVTSLVFAAIGNVWAPILMIAFSIFYGIISWKFRYWGEVITYLGMTMPMAIWSTITWIKNPAKNGKEVAIQKLTKKHFLLVAVSTVIVTAVFYMILAKLNTPNMYSAPYQSQQVLLRRH